MIRGIKKSIAIVAVLMALPACSTTVAVLDVAGTTVVYAGKTVVNTLDAITPNIVNRD
jgi:ABC-type oligopeptide transport system substrate-binding subunit